MAQFVDVMTGFAVCVMIAALDGAGKLPGSHRARWWCSGTSDDFKTFALLFRLAPKDAFEPACGR
jgi:hypothetical protein